MQKQDSSLISKLRSAASEDKNSTFHELNFKVPDYWERLFRKYVIESDQVTEDAEFEIIEPKQLSQPK